VTVKSVTWLFDRPNVPYGLIGKYPFTHKIAKAVVVFYSRQSAECCAIDPVSAILILLPLFPSYRLCRKRQQELSEAGLNGVEAGQDACVIDCAHDRDVGPFQPE
jgi:hypothetical protein